MNATKCSDSAQLEPRPEFQFDDFQLLQPVSVDDLADIFCGDAEAEEWFRKSKSKRHMTKDEIAYMDYNKCVSFL